MTDDVHITPQEFAAAFRRVMEWAHIEEREARSPFKAMLTEHFGAHPANFPVDSANGVSPPVNAHRRPADGPGNATISPAN